MRGFVAWVLPAWALGVWIGACSSAGDASATVSSRSPPSTSEPPSEPRAQTTRASLPIVIERPEADPVAPIDEDAPARYRVGSSPLTRRIVDRLSAALASSPHRRDVIAKVGDSITATPAFLDCFSRDDAQLLGHEDLEPTRAFFARAIVDGAHSSFDRPTLAARVGWHAFQTIDGAPSPLLQEITAIDAAFAVVMLGTNDTWEAEVPSFERALSANVDRLLSLGVIPILSTLPPRADTAAARALVPEMNAVVRAIAQSHQTPLIDLAASLEQIPGGGLAGDGIHLSAASAATACAFDDDGLSHGMNQRNLLTLSMLDRVRRIVLDGAPPDAAPAPLEGDGGWSTPFVVDALPFVDDRDTRAQTTREVDAYPCGGDEEAGPEVIYSLEVAVPMHLRARVFTDDGVDVDMHWLDGPTASTCVARGDRRLDLDVLPGRHRLAIDTASSSGNVAAGAYRLTIVRIEE